MKNKLIFITVLFIILFVAYYPVLTVHQTVSPDAYFLLPFFDKIESLGDYLHHLFTLRAYDFQPVRDLSLFIDWKIFHSFKINIFIWHNLVLWFIACFFIKKTLNKIFPDLAEIKAMIFTWIFAIYPLFVGTIAWSIARKHLLAFLFIVLSTYYFLDWLDTHKNKSAYKVTLFYFLSLLSQPIAILWVFWAIIYSWPVIKHKKSLFISLSLFFILGFITNYIYYTKSQFFAGIFEGKTGDTWRFDLKIFAIGQYFQQIFFPYEQIFQYGLDYKYTIQGYFAFTLITLLYFFLRRPTRFYLQWFLFALIPMGVVLNTPRLIMDYYLLLSGLGFFILAVMIIKDFSLKRIVILTIIPSFAWIMFTNYQSTFWTDEIKFGNRNFYSRPNCVNAKSLASTIFSKGHLPPRDIIQFMEKNNCYDHKTPYQQIELVVYLSYLAFYDPNITPEDKINSLNRLAEKNFFPRLLLSNLYLTQGNYEKVNLEIDRIAEILGGNSKLDNMYDKIAPQALHEYCQRVQHNKCLQFTSQLVNRPELPYF